jgi:hypothetical protein
VVRCPLLYLHLGSLWCKALQGPSATGRPWQQQQQYFAFAVLIKQRIPRLGRGAAICGPWFKRQGAAVVAIICRDGGPFPGCCALNLASVDARGRAGAFSHWVLA